MDPFSNLYMAGTSGRNQRQRSLAGDGAAGSGEPPNEDDLRRRKLVHRDLERQRRQEMAALFATLRNLLPLEYIKGKRAVSDQINGAVSFIKDKQERIRELSARKVELKRYQADQSNPDPNIAGSSSYSNPACVMVHPYPGGLEVVVSSLAAGFEPFALSRFLQVIQSHDLEIICCLSTRVNERLMHTIQVEASDPASFDVAWLQQKLTEELSMMG